MKKIWVYFLIAAAIVLVYLIPLTGRPLLSPDETRYAEIPREMIASGNFISPRLNGVRYFEKTPLLYWCTAGSFLLFGESRFSLRLPCMLAILGTAWIVFLLMSSFYERRTAFFGAWIYLTLPICFLLGSVALTDSILSFFVTASLAAYFAAMQEEKHIWKQRGWLFLCGIFCGMAFMAKGFISAAVPVITIVSWQLWERRWKKIFTTPWLPLLGMILVVLPWGIAIHRAEPDFWRYFIVVEHFNRFFGGAAAQHPKSPLYFIPVYLVAILPWIFMVPNILKSLRPEIGKSSLLRFCICGTVMPFLFFSASSGKLPTYILPCFAFTAILIAAGVEKFFLTEQKTRAFHLTLYILFIGMVLTVAASVINLTTGFPVCFFLKEDLPQIGLLGVTLLGVSAIFLSAGKMPECRTKLILYLTALMLVVISSNFIFPAMVKGFKAPSDFFADVRKDLPKDEVTIVCCCRPFQDICYSFRSDRVYIYQATNEIEYGLFHPEAKRQGRFIKNFDLLEQRFWTWKKEKKPILLVVNTADVEYFQKHLDRAIWIKRSFPGTEDGFSVMLF